MNLCSRSEKQYPSGTDLVSRLFFVTLLISRKFLTSSKLHRKSVIEIAFFGVLEFSNYRGFCCSTFHIIGFTVLALIDVWESIFLVVSLCSWYFCLHFNDGFWKGQVFISQKTCKITCPKPCKAEGKGKKVYKKWNKKVTKLTTVHLSQSWSRILLHFSSVVVFKKNTIFKALCKVIMFEHLRGNYKRSHLFLWCNYLWDKIFCVKWHTKIAQDSREKMLKLHFLGKNWLLLVFSPLLLGKDDITFDIANVLAITKSHLAARKPISFLISQYISKNLLLSPFLNRLLIKSLWFLMRKKPAGKNQ